jgi:hypothetical protein
MNEELKKDMLDALYAAEDQMSQCESMFRDDEDFMEALNRVREAIAHAEGRESWSSDEEDLKEAIAKGTEAWKDVDADAWLEDLRGGPDE